MSRIKIFYSSKARLLTGLSLTTICMLVLFFSSCKDNPVVPKTTPSYQFDTARYNWKMDTIDGTIFHFWVQDTSNIYFLASHEMIYDNNYNYMRFPIEFSFDPVCISGLDRNNIYIGGMDNTQQNYGKPAIRKWNGSAFEEVPVQDSANKFYYLNTCYVRSSNEIWFGSMNGRILKYDGAGSFTFFVIDTNFYINRFLTDQSSNFYYFAYRDSSNIQHTSGKGWIQIYQYYSLQWVMVYSKEYIYGGTLNPRPIVPFQLNNQIAGFDDHNLYQFTNNEFNKFLQVYELIMFTLAGSSLNNVMVFGNREQPPPPESNLFHWNGKRWSKEFTYPNNWTPPVWINPMQAVGENMFLGTDGTDAGTYDFRTIIFKGRLRTK